MGCHSFSLISQKSRNSDAFRRMGKRYELPGCVCLFESFRRSRSGGQRARGSVRRCKVSVQITEKWNKRCRLLFEPRKIFVRFSDIRIFANIRTIRFNPSGSNPVKDVFLCCCFFFFAFFRSLSFCPFGEFFFSLITFRLTTRRGTTFDWTFCLFVCLFHIYLE